MPRSKGSKSASGLILSPYLALRAAPRHSVICISCMEHIKGARLSIDFKKARAVLASSTIQCVSCDAQRMVSVGMTWESCAERASSPKVFGTKYSVPSFDAVFIADHFVREEFQNQHPVVAHSL